MGRQFLDRGFVRAGRSRDPCGVDHKLGRSGEIEAGLSAAEQFEIDGGKQAAIDLRPVLDAIGKVDGEAPAQRIEARRRTWKRCARSSRSARHVISGARPGEARPPALRSASPRCAASRSALALPGLGIGRP